MTKQRKHLCGQCKKNIALWYYIPSSSKSRIRYYCDECVPRGCSCNSKHITEFPLPKDENINNLIWSETCTEWHKDKQETDKYYEETDELGRRFPCCEFDFSEDGYLLSDDATIYFIKVQDVFDTLLLAKEHYKEYKNINDIYDFYNEKISVKFNSSYVITYNDIMSYMSEITTSQMKLTQNRYKNIDEKIYKLFYNRCRLILLQKRFLINDF